MLDWKHYHCVQDNGPNYYAITDGKWGSPSIAHCFATEREAKILGASTKMGEALNRCLDTLSKAAEALDKAGYHPDFYNRAIDQAESALLAAGYTED